MCHICGININFKRNLLCYYICQLLQDQVFDLVISTYIGTLEAPWWSNGRSRSMWTPPSSDRPPLMILHIWDSMELYLHKYHSSMKPQWLGMWWRFSHLPQSPHFEFDHLLHCFSMFTLALVARMSAAYLLVDCI